MRTLALLDDRSLLMQQKFKALQGISLGFAALLALSLSACGGGDKDANTPPDQPVASTTDQNSTAASGAPVAEASNSANAANQSAPASAVALKEGSVDPNSTTSMIEAEEGKASTSVPQSNKNGSVHKGEALVFVVVGEYGSEDKAKAALEEVNKKLVDAKDAFYVLSTADITGFDNRGKFVVAEIYPNLDAVQGYDAVNFAQSVAPDGFKAYAQAGTFNSDKPVVVFGVDVQ